MDVAIYRPAGVGLPPPACPVPFVMPASRRVQQCNSATLRNRPSAHLSQSVSADLPCSMFPDILVHYSSLSIDYLLTLFYVSAATDNNDNLQTLLTCCLHPVSPALTSSTPPILTQPKGKPFDTARQAGALSWACARVHASWQQIMRLFLPLLLLELCMSVFSSAQRRSVCLSVCLSARSGRPTVATREPLAESACMPLHCSALIPLPLPQTSITLLSVPSHLHFSHPDLPIMQSTSQTH